MGKTILSTDSIFYLYCINIRSLLTITFNNNLIIIDSIVTNQWKKIFKKWLFFLFNFLLSVKDKYDATIRC